MLVDFLPHILQEEGGYVNDPSDSGGATNRGITQSTYDLHRDAKKFDRRHVLYLTLEETSEIYEKIWVDCRADRLPVGLNLTHFDFAVNAGNKRAAVTLQKCLGVKEDGIIGPATLKAAEEKNGEDLIKAYSDERRGFYRRLAERRTKDKRFLRGWLLRTERMEKRAIDAYRKSIKNSGPSTV